MKQFLGQSLALLALALLAGCGGGGFSPNNTSINSVSTATPGSSTGTSGNNSGGNSPGPSGAPANAKTIADIQKMPSWENCTDCAGGTFAAYSMTENIGSPSLSGASAKFSLEGGTAPFGLALWWKYLVTDNSATHFVYDLDFYMDNSSAAQALEFNVSQSAGGARYDFATQCDLDSFSDHTWRVWNPVNKGWTSSSAYCPQPAANTWNHLTWEFERNSSGQAVFKAVTLNGKRAEINLSMPSRPDGSNGIDVAFQLDANRNAALYSVWLDKVSLTYW